MTFSAIMMACIVCLLGFIASRINRLLDWRDSISVDVAVTKNKIDDIKETTDIVVDKIEQWKEDVKDSHSKTIDVFMSEINPIEKRVGTIELDVKKIKVHLNYKE